jgi:hypothetical protein
MIVDNTGQVNIFFGWPKNSPVSNAEFHVKIEYEGEYNTGSMPNSIPGHTNIKTLGDWTLGGEIPLMIKGGGVFYITVYSVRGRGDWYCMFSPTGREPYPEKPIISKPETKKPDADDHHHGGNQGIVGIWEITGLSGTGMESITLTFNSDGTWIHMTDTAADKPFYFRGTYETIGNTIKMKTLYSRSEGERWNSLKSFNLTSEANIDGNKLTYSEFRSFTYTKK